MLNVVISMILSIASIPFQFVSVFFRVITDFKLLSILIIPYIIGLFSFFLFLYLSFDFRDQIAIYLIPDFLKNYSTLFAWFVFIINWFVSALLAIFIMLIFGGYFIEKFLETYIKQKGLAPLETSGLKGYVKAVIKGVTDSIIRALVYGSLSILIFAFSFIPPLAFLILLLGGFTIGYDLIDMPLSLLGLNTKQRLDTILSHKIETTALGSFFSIILLLPLGGIFFLPFAYLVAVDKISYWHAHKD